MKTIALIIKELFSYSLIFYLILFLLETLFPGFVSDVFSLNWVLGGVLILGIITALLPQDEEPIETKKPTPFDYIFTVALGIIGALIILWKVQLDNKILHLAISILSGLLITFMGAIILIFPDEVATEEEIENLPPIQQTTLNIKRFIASKIQIPASFVVVFVLLTGFFISNRPQPKVVEKVAEVIPIVTPEITEKPLPLADPSVKIMVYNAGTEAGEAKRVGNLFKTVGYKEIEAKDSEKKIENALIEFREAESDQADLVEDVLKGEYLIVNRTPLATDSAQINVYLGAQP